MIFDRRFVVCDVMFNELLNGDWLVRAGRALAAANEKKTLNGEKRARKRERSS
jgi:hypothetical protein